MTYTYIKSYKDNDKMRKSLNELTEKNFGFNFENWYCDDRKELSWSGLESLPYREGNR